MITLYRSKDNNPFANEIEHTLKNLVVAFTIKKCPEIMSTENKLPFLDENGSIIAGRKKIEGYLKKLSSELQQQRAITGDGCYIDPKTGDIC